ncbi:hypothetical protein S83_026180 [Arachis hypogaea]
MIVSMAFLQIQPLSPHFLFSFYFVQPNHKDLSGFHSIPDLSTTASILCKYLPLLYSNFFFFFFFNNEDPPPTALP